MESSFRGYPSNQIPHRHHIFAHPVSEFELELDGPSGSSYYTARSTPGSPSQFDPPTLSGGVPPRLQRDQPPDSDKNGSLEGSRLHIPIDLAHKLEPSSPECKPPISSPSEDCPDLSSTLGIASDAARGDRSPASESSSSVDTVRSQQMTSLDMFQCLVKHGCVDLTSFISPEKYSSCRVAEGAFGDIWKGETQDGASVAVKVLRFGLLTSSEGKSLKRMMREIYAWSKLDHENVHKLLGVTMVEGRLGMVSKWMAQGNLRDYLGQTKGLDRHGMCVQIAKGVEYIHSKDMIHGDLKASNILVSSDGVLKLTDFDHSLIPECSLLFTDTTQIGGGTPRWMAPELFSQTSHQRTKETDVYALGMTFLEIITGSPPYYPQCSNDVQVMFKVAQKIIPDRSPDYFAGDLQGDGMWQLLTRCWEYDPTLRPTAQVVLESVLSFPPLPKLASAASGQGPDLSGSI